MIFNKKTKNCFPKSEYRNFRMKVVSNWLLFIFTAFMHPGQYYWEMGSGRDSG